MTKRKYCNRLIEVDFPIKRISEHSRREKSIRHGHISTLHIWWARRPLAACRAVICASLWPDPADPLCPAAFREKAKELMLQWTPYERQVLLSAESRPRFETARKNPKTFDDIIELRKALLDFIADFSNWDNSTVKEYLETSRTLTQSAHEVLGGTPGTRPLVVDPFAGGGSIPLEALRVGADAFASDLNPIPVLLNKVVLEYVPKYGQRLADEVRKWGAWIKHEAEKELAKLYPRDPDGATPIAYLWARTIQCEGPGCGAEIPLLRSLWLAKKGERTTALQLKCDSDEKSVSIKLIQNAHSGKVSEGTIKGGTATCPCCSYTIHNVQVRAQLAKHNGGASNARLIAVITTFPGKIGRFYRLPTKEDLLAVRKSVEALSKVQASVLTGTPLVPIEPIAPERPSPNARGLSAVTRMGMKTFSDLFLPRQLVALSCLSRLISGLDKELKTVPDKNFVCAIKTCLGLALSKSADLNNSICTWRATSECVDHMFARQAISITWDFAEAVLVGDSTGSWESMYNRSADGIESALIQNESTSVVEQSSATKHSLPNDSIALFCTDPPYYDAIPYADLSDFFYVWLRRAIAGDHPNLLSQPLTPKDEEAIWNPSRVYSRTGRPKDQKFYESQMEAALDEGRRITSPSGIGIVVFAHKSTDGWEAMLAALINAGWIVTASWPIDTEMASRVNAMGTASLASSVHLVCRPHENSDGSVPTDEIGDWRDVLQELPRRIHEWMPRLAKEGVIGADAIFACLGPALEIFSRYSSVEKANGEKVSLKEYLEHVWATVAKEALSMIFEGAHTEGFEEDARLTAMWLWTLSTAANGNCDVEEEDIEDNEDSTGIKSARVFGFTLEYDAARKIAQGLGVHPEDMQTVVQVTGDKATLMAVTERIKYLFAKESLVTAGSGRKKKKDAQMDWFAEIEKKEESPSWSLGDEKSAVGKTVLDRLHQAMILFGAGRAEAMRRFLVDEAVGKDERFWRLAQALSALYPSHTDEKRWVDGVLARKKSLGF